MTVDGSDRSIVRLIFLEDGETFGVLDECAVVYVESAALDDLESGVPLDELIRDGKATMVRTAVMSPHSIAPPVPVSPPTQLGHQGGEDAPDGLDGAGA